MKWWTDIFSGHFYTKDQSTIQRDDGKVFYKTGDSYVDDQGQIIKEFGGSMTNMNTGISSKWGDPFGDNE